MTRPTKRDTGELSSLFTPLLVAGLVITAFGLVSSWIGHTVITLKEEGSEAFKLIGLRFSIVGVLSISAAYLVKYRVLVKYIWKQLRYKRSPKENKFSDWYKP
jgi:Na+/H+-translocating membrane pyrophosphatase